VRDSNTDPPLTLEAAQEKFIAFLASQNWPKTICWVAPAEVLIDRKRQYWIKPNCRHAGERAALRYTEGLGGNLGICLQAISANETETFATVFIPEDDLDAQSRLMGHSLKLTCPVETYPTFVTRNPLKWLVLRLVNGKRSRGFWL
jgi:hypothetical protein